MLPSVSIVARNRIREGSSRRNAATVSPARERLREGTRRRRHTSSATARVYRAHSNSLETTAKALHETDSVFLGENPRTFTQPFKYFVHYHETFQQELERLRDKAPQLAVSDQSYHHNVKNHDEFEEAETLKHLECFINFAENDIMHHIHDVREMSPAECAMVCFDHLWYFFRPGDLIFVPPKTLSKAVANMVIRTGITGESGLGHASSMQQRIWKLHGTWSFYNPKGPCFRVFAHYLDFDGTSYNAADLDLDIEYFQGDREVRELDFYPLKFANRVDELAAESKMIGGLYTKFLKERHLAYNGWTLVTNPMGVPILDTERSWQIRRQARPVHIEGDVIIDFREAFNSNPVYRSPFLTHHTYGYTKTGSYLTRERHPFLVWSDSQRSKLVASKSDFLFQTNELDDIERVDYWATDKYLNSSATSKDKMNVAEDDLILLPPRLFAYALEERIFVPIDVRFLKPIAIQENAFEQLQLPDIYKSMLKAAVESHARRQDIEKQLENKGDHLRTQDFIRGKGRGLNIMHGSLTDWPYGVAVHGEPGVGKTATAETVSQWTRRPLFPVAMAFFGTIRETEAKMEEIFRLAHLWGCIVILDEADVFLEARTGSGYSNDLVTIFLRKIEYFNGILFLTTNRIGKLDQALGSRIHLILHYKRLGLDQSREVFRLNVLRLREAEDQQCQVSGEKPVFIMEEAIMRFAADHYSKFPKGKGAWNGRQIRNAFLLATSLARGEAQRINDPNFQPQLRYEHFEQVEKMTREYDLFRAHLLGGDDARKARLNEERDDDFDLDEISPGPTSRYGGMESSASVLGTRPMAASPRSLSSLVRVGPNPPMSYVDPTQGVGGLTQGPIPRAGGSQMAESGSQGIYTTSLEEMNIQATTGPSYARHQQHLSPPLARPGYSHFASTGSAFNEQSRTGGPPPSAN
ncbi:hypothetical protein PG984_013984 [Apiospora sp. TS-2023a]